MIRIQTLGDQEIYYLTEEIIVIDNLIFDTKNRVTCELTEKEQEMIKRQVEKQKKNELPPLF